LSFDQETSQQILQKGGEEALVKIQQTSPNQEARSIATSAIRSLIPGKKIDEETKQLQIMISYNWGNQEVVKKISQHLEDNGYKLWLDLNNMSGNTLEAIAEAVDSSQIILICASEKYKRSKNCILEAQYAYQQSKETIPLLFETSALTGWLGALIGTKPYFDFSNPSFFETSIQNLLEELKLKSKKWS